MYKKYHFTLVELLVVIAIISILASLLLPTLAEARSQALDIVCVSNLKQIGYGIMLYSDENDGFTPHHETGASTPIPYSKWQDHLLKYLSSVKLVYNNSFIKEPLFACPSQQLPLTSSANIGRHYGINFYAYHSNYPSAIVPFFKRVNHPEQRMLLVDINRTSANPYTTGPSYIFNISDYFGRHLSKTGVNIMYGNLNVEPTQTIDIEPSVDKYFWGNLVRN